MSKIEVLGEQQEPKIIRDFVHLHMHSTYSLLDGAQLIGDINKPKKEYGILNKVKELGMSAAGITDHGNMYGVLDFYKKAKAGGVKPILGCEVYVAPGDRRDKSPPTGGHRRSYHFVLLAKDYEGYRNLCKLVSRGFFEGFYYNPRIDKELLRKYSKGLIGFSACLAGEVAQNCMKGRMEEAVRVAKEYQEILEGNFYIELQQNRMKKQTEINPMLAEIGRELDIPLVATNDVHYLTREDAKAQDILMAIQTRKTINDKDRMRHEVEEFYLKSPDEMWDSFHEWPEACANTLKIAEQCNVELPLDQHFFPKIETPPEIEDNVQFMEKLSWDGLEKRLEVILQEHPEDKHEEVRKEYNERLIYELDIIKGMGLAEYFLIVADFINWAKENGIPVGPGRGSAAGSLVAFVMRITNIDPIKHVLLFERFLNPERVSMPDVDVDFCESRREEVIDYVRRRYAVEDGEAVAQISTFGKLKAKAVIRDVGRALAMEYKEVDTIAKLIPNVLNIRLQEAIDQEPRLQKLAKEDHRVSRLLDIAKRLEGLNRHASIHAAGVVISDGRPLDEHLPLYKGAKDEVVTQFDMKGVEAIGLIKFDFLGLKNLTLIQHCIEQIKTNHGEELDIDAIDLEEPKTYELLKRGDTIGVFQLESSGMRGLMKRLKPSCFDDVIALVALYRPGPLNSGMADSFIRRKHGEEPITYDFPQLKPIMDSTYGVCIYQEQVMQTANVLANYSLGEADLLRRAMGKKIAEEMAKQRVRFLAGAKENELDLDKAGRTFDILEEFAAYGFNRSHSAAYGLIAYQTAWLKTHYPHEYMAALLTADSGNSDKLLLYMNDCEEHGIEVLPPDVNESQLTFAVVNDRIRFGLSGVKGIGDGAIEAIVAERNENGKYESLFDFCKRVDLKKVNRRVIEALIKSGAFDSTNCARSAALEGAEMAIKYGQQIKKEKASSQFSLFGTGFLEPQTPTLPDIEEWLEKQRLAYEKEVLGLYMSGHPLNRYRADLPKLASCVIAELEERKAGEVLIAGIITSITDKKTKRGDRMAFIVLEDLTGSVEVSIFPRAYQAAAPYLDGDQPLVIKGNMEKDDRGSTKIIAKEVRSLAEVRLERANKLHLAFTSDEISAKDISKLYQIMDEHKGHCRVNFHIEIPEHSKVLLQIDKSFTVMPDEEFVEKLERLFGRNPSYIS